MGKLTKAQRARLEKLATYLEGLPKRYRHFDMRAYVRTGDEDALIRYAQRNGGVAALGCGTVACAVGHGPAAGILVPRRFIQKGVFDYKYVNWDGYGALFVGGEEIDSADDWCFGANWGSCDNHHYGAAARIRYLLARGAAPDGYCEPSRRYRDLYAPYRIDAKAKADA